MALEDIDGVAGAFVSKKLELFLSKNVDITAETLTEKLKPFKISVKNVAKSDKVEF